MEGKKVTVKNKVKILVSVETWCPGDGNHLKQFLTANVHTKTARFVPAKVFVW